MITSLSNPKIKFLRKLKNKKFRDETGLFYAEGPRIIAEAFEEGWKFNQIVFCKELINDTFSQQLLQKLSKLNVELLEVEPDVFESFSIKDGPKGLAASIYQKVSPKENILEKSGIWVVLDRIQDPGNLGTIFRTVDAVGGKGIILLDHCTDAFDINVIRGSMGAFFSLDLVKLTSTEFIDFVKKNEISLIGTSDHAKDDYQKINYEENIILLMGSEREGLSNQLIHNCDRLVRIPMVGKSDSLNLAVATSVCLYEIFNQRKNENRL